MFSIMRRTEAVSAAASETPDRNVLIAQYNFDDPGGIDKRYIFDQGSNGIDLYKNGAMTGEDFWNIEAGAGTWWNQNVFTPRLVAENRTAKRFKADFQPLWKGHTAIYLRLKLARSIDVAPEFNARLTENLVDTIGSTYAFTRATIATVIDHQGVVQYCKSGEARFEGSQRVDHGTATDYDTGALGVEYITTENSKGVLIEEARTNLCLKSDDMPASEWAVSNVNKRPVFATAPDGQLYRCRIQAAAGNGTILQSITSVSANRVFSLWMRRVKGTGNIDLTCDGSTWTTKAITNSWARYNITQAAVTDPQVGVRIVASGDEVEIWGMQCETGAYVTSYIPTVAASVTRNKDLLKYTKTPATNNMAFAVDWTPKEDAATTHYLMTCENGATNTLDLRYLGGDLMFRKRISDVETNATETLDITAEQTYTVGGRLDSTSGVDLWRDATKKTNNANTANAVLGTEIEIGSWGDGSQAAACFKNARYYNEAHTDAEMVTLTTISDGMICGVRSGLDGANTDTGFGIYISGEALVAKITEATVDTYSVSQGIRDNGWANYFIYVDAGNELAIYSSNAISTTDISASSPLWLIEDEQIWSVGGSADLATQAITNIALSQLEWYWHENVKPTMKQLYVYKNNNPEVAISTLQWKAGSEDLTANQIKARLSLAVNWNFGTAGNITSVPQLYQMFHTRLSFGTPRGTAQQNASQWSRHRENPGMEAYSDLGANYDAAGEDVHIITDNSLKLMAVLDPDMTDGNISSGYIRHKTSVWSGKYGYYETRVKLIAQPAGSKGHWSAFWLTSVNEIAQTGMWPPEIDIFEIVDTGTGGKLGKSFHSTHGPEDGEGGTVTYTRGDANRGYEPADSETYFADGYHTFGMWWQDKKITWYVDDVKVMEHDWPDGWIHSAAAGSGDGGDANVICNMSVGGVWPGAPTSVDHFPMGMEIDYIKIWQ